MHFKLDENLRNKQDQTCYNAIKKSRMLRSQQKYSKINKIQNQLKHHRQVNSPYQKNIYKRNYSQPKIKANYFQKLIQNVPNDQIIIQHYIEKLKQLKKKVKSERRKSQRLQSKQDLQCYQIRKLIQDSSLVGKTKVSKQNNEQKMNKDQQKKQKKQIKQIINESKKKLKNNNSNLITFQSFRNKVKEEKLKSVQKKCQVKQQTQDLSIDQIYQFKQKDIKRSPQEKVFIRDKRKHSSKLKIIQSDFRKINGSIPNSSDLIANNRGLIANNRDNLNSKKQKLEQQKKAKTNQNQKNQKISGYYTKKRHTLSQQKEKNLRAQKDYLQSQQTKTKNNVIIQKIFNIQQNINVFKKDPYLCRRKQNDRPRQIMKSMQLRRPKFNQRQKTTYNNESQQINDRQYESQQIKNKQYENQKVKNKQQYAKPYQIFKSMQIKKKVKSFGNQFNHYNEQNYQKNNQKSNKNILHNQIYSEVKENKRYSKSLSKLNKLSQNYYQNQQINNSEKQFNLNANNQTQSEQIKKQQEIKNYLKSIQEFSTIQMKKQTLQFLGESCINIKHGLIESEKKMNKILDLLGLKTDQLNEAITSTKKKKKTQYQKFNKIFPQGFFQ